MADTTLADAFTQNYTAMQGNQRANQQLDLQKAEQLASQHYQQAKLDWDQNPDNPINQYHLAQTDYTKNRLGPAIDRADAAQTRADAEAQKVSERGSLDRIQGAVKDWSNGTDPGVAALALTADEQPKFQQAVQSIQDAAYKQKLDAATQKHLSTITGATPQAEGQSIAQGATGGFMQSAGNPLAAVMGAVQGAVNPEEQQGQQVAQAIWQAHKEVGAPPDPNDWQNAVHPAWAEKKARDASIIQQQQAHTQLYNSAAARNQVMSQLAPQQFQLKQDALDEQTAHHQALEQQFATNEEWKKFYQGGVLDTKKTLANIAQQNANTAAGRLNLSAQQGLQKNAAFARGVAKWEYQQNSREIDKIETTMRSYQKQRDTLQPFLPPPTTPDTEPVNIGGQTMTAGQARALYTSLDAELQANVPSSLAARSIELQRQSRPLYDALQISGPDQQPVNAAGKPLSYGKLPGGAKPVGAVPGAPAVPSAPPSGKVDQSAILKKLGQKYLRGQ